MERLWSNTNLLNINLCCSPTKSSTIASFLRQLILASKINFLKIFNSNPARFNERQAFSGYRIDKPNLCIFSPHPGTATLSRHAAEWKTESATEKARFGTRPEKSQSKYNILIDLKLG